MRVFRDESGDVRLHFRKKITPKMEKISQRLEKQPNFRRCVSAEEKLVLAPRQGVIPVL